MQNDNPTDEEGQSALVFAQKLMTKYNIKRSDIEDYETIDEIAEDKVMIYKKLRWWERKLAEVISENFRVKMYYKGSNSTCIIFYGFESDLELAKEMYLLAYETVIFHSKHYIDKWYEKHFLFERERAQTMELKRSYIKGFIQGLDVRFQEQVAELQEKNELMVLIPKEVEEAYAIMSKNFGTYTINEPEDLDGESYFKGYDKGRQIDFTQSTVGMTDYTFLIGKHINFAVNTSEDVTTIWEECVIGKVLNVDNEKEQAVVKYYFERNGSPIFMINNEFDVSNENSYWFPRQEEISEFEYHYSFIK